MCDKTIKSCLNLQDSACFQSLTDCQTAVFSWISELSKGPCQSEKMISLKDLPSDVRGLLKNAVTILNDPSGTKDLSAHLSLILQNLNCSIASYNKENQTDQGSEALVQIDLERLSHVTASMSGGFYLKQQYAMALGGLLGLCMVILFLQLLV